MDLTEFLSRALPGHQASEVLQQPLAELNHVQRSLIATAACFTVSELSVDAFTEVTTWQDLGHWISHAESFKRISPVAGSRYQLRPIAPSDVPALFAAAFHPDRCERWKYRGTTMSLEQFAQDLYAGALSQFTVIRPDMPSEPIGMVVAYDADLRNGNASLGVLRCVDRRTGGALIEAAAIFIEYLFDHFPLRNLYVEVVESNKFLGEPLVDLGIAEQVARIPGHSYVRSGFEDLLVFQIRRELWTEASKTWFPRDVGGVDASA